jgi:ribosomal protein S18 acetylase RimI-like enzyme
LSVYEGINGRTKPGFDQTIKLLESFADQTCLVASPTDEPDEIAAVANVGFNHGHQKAWIAGIATHPDYQGQGIGSEMMERIEEEARNRHLASLALYSVQQEKTISFYNKRGFYVDDSLRQPDSTTRLIPMSKNIDSL